MCRFVCVSLIRRLVLLLIQLGTFRVDFQVVNFESSSDIICDALEDLAYILHEQPAAS